MGLNQTELANAWWMDYPKCLDPANGPLQIFRDSGRGADRLVFHRQEIKEQEMQGKRAKLSETCMGISIRFNKAQQGESLHHAKPCKPSVLSHRTALAVLLEISQH